MEALPTVSVLIPAHNRRDVLSRAIASVLNQTFSDFELLVVDDGSTDGTVAFVRGIADPRIRLLCLGSNHGVGRARNAGIQAARGGLVAFLDSDDEWLPGKLERQVARFRDATDQRVGVVYCRCAAYEHATQRERGHRHPLYEGDVFLRLLGGWQPPTASVVMVDRATLARVGAFDEAVPYAEDYDLWLRLAQASVHFLGVDEVLAIKHDSEGWQLSADPAIRARALRILRARWGPLIRRHLGRGSYRRWQAKQSARVHETRYARVVDALARGDRRAAWKDSLAMFGSRPWGAWPFRTFALALLGPRWHRGVTRAWAAVVSRPASR